MFDKVKGYDPSDKRRFMMGNALVVNLIRDMEKTLNVIIEKE